MKVKLKTKRIAYALLMLALPFLANAQTKTVSGKVTSDIDGSPISGVSVVAKGTSKGTQTNANGDYTIEVAENVKTLVISSVGFSGMEVSANGANTDVVMKASGEGLTEVVVIGYGTARKKDLTGSVGSVSAKNFNKGPIASPDLLIQGKTPGVQVLTNNGAPGGGTTIRIRGASSLRAGNNPLFIIDGVPLSNTNSRPNLDLTGDIGGSTPGGNPLNFINSADIASIEVLKDASAAAIYGSRAANGVVLITTKRGQAGSPKVDFSMSVGTSKIAKKLEVLTGDEYRAALTQFGAPGGNFGGNTDALGAILRNGTAQNYSVGLSSGNENARYRLSLGYLDQKGIIRKTDFKKYSAALNSSFKMLDSKKLNVDVNISTTQTIENIAPISSRAGFRGNLIGQALQWNPTRSLFKPGSDSLFIEYGSGDNINPLAYSDAYFDNAKVTTVLASVAPSYKFNDHLEYKTLMSVNYSTGLRRQYTTAYININDLAINTTAGSPTFGKGGEASISQNELVTKQITNTLSFNQDLSSNLYLNAIVGHEYIKTDFGGGYQYGRTLLVSDKPYYNYLGSSEQGNRRLTNFQDPSTELQSFFARAIFNFKDKYLFTGTVRTDGSSKFGSGNRYGTFPSVAVGWNISKENFMKNIDQISNLKFRASYGITGNQDYPPGVALTSYRLNNSSPASFEQFTNFNPDLSWESTQTTNLGLDFGILKGRVNITADYFRRVTSKILFAKDAADPAPPGSAVKWENLPNAEINNNGFELAINSSIIQKKDFNLGLNVNLTFLRNKFVNYNNEIPTGEINGQGLSGAFSQLIKTDFPLNTFYLKKYTGIDKATGISTYEGGEERFFLGSANPTTLVGFTVNAGYKKLSLEASMNGAFGHFIYNNTANAVLAFNNLGKRNIGKRELDIAIRDGEKTVNPTSASSRYLEKGDYLRMANLTLSYNVGAVGKVFKSSSVYITAQNLFIITDFSGFDPEVNVDKAQNGIPSFGLEYTPYPSARTFNLGVNFSL